MTEYHVGQKVILFSGQPKDSGSEVEITRVGRSVVGIELYGRERTFRMSDGYDSKHTDNTPGPPSYILTLEEQAAAVRRSQAKHELMELGFTPRYYAGWDYPTELLEKIIELVKEAAQ